MQWLRKFSNLWSRLSERERRLAIGVGALVALAAVLWSVRGALDTLDTLDRQIALAEDSLVSNEQQIKLREAVEDAYAQVAWQHSSAWTAAEILDRLRNEIYRLSYVSPSPLNDQGIAELVENDSGQLIRRPELGEGSLEEEEEGYREYRIRVRIENEPFGNFVDYIERLQMSPQSLRIDGLDMIRNYFTDHISASLDISRIIVDRVEDTWEQVPQGIGQWVGLGCAIAAGAPMKPGEEAAVVITPAGPKGAAYLEIPVEGSGAYEVQFTARARGSAIVQAYDTRAGANLDGEITLRGDDEFHTYQVRLTLSGDGPATVRMPFFALDGSESRVIVGGVGLRKHS
jgi:type II secretory pathway component PulM